jgi:hypothetical protein
MYKDIAKNLELFEIKYPETVVPTPKETDYGVGFIRRYFVRKANDVNGHIFEIDDKAYSEYTNSPFWITENIKWRIKGPLEPTYNKRGEIEDKGVRNSNASAISRASFNMKNIKLYLPNLLQFYRQ